MNDHPRITSFYFVRHGPVVKRDGHLPPYDPPLTDGPFDCDGLCSRLPQGADWHISPLRRTVATADLLHPILAPKSISNDKQLIEMDFGDWHDQPVADVWDNLKNGPKHNWSFILPDTKPPGGESFIEQCARISGWLDLMAQNPPENPQIIITHAGVIRAAMRHILDIQPEQAIGIPIAHFGCLHANVMVAERALDAGGAWQFTGLA